MDQVDIRQTLNVGQSHQRPSPSNSPLSVPILLDDLSHNPRTEPPKYVKHELNQKVKKYKSNLESLKGDEGQLKKIYYVMAFAGLILGSVLSMLLGSRSIHDVSNSFDLVLFFMSLFANIIQSVISFSNIQPKFESMHNSAQQYYELLTDIDVFKLNKHNDEDGFVNFIDKLSEKEKMIKSTQESACF